MVQSQRIHKTKINNIHRHVHRGAMCLMRTLRATTICVFGRIQLSTVCEIRSLLFQILLYKLFAYFIHVEPFGLDLFCAKQRQMYGDQIHINTVECLAQHALLMSCVQRTKEKR